ncbi:TetR/AcrR family transcriptional regulator [Oleomonas cavernae]|nr:TetR/AcrR family transcriptional regulator [Oleomonas cavernae]
MSDSLSRPAVPSALRAARTRGAGRPVQERSQERIARALAAAERLVVEVGLERVSIPEIEKASKVPRASIYQYFPDKYAIFSRLSQDHMQRYMAFIMAAHPAGRHTEWRTMVRAVLADTAAYYNANAAASVLLLKGPFSSTDHDAHLAKDANLARWLRTQFADAGLAKLPEVPDVMALAVEIAFACLKYGYSHEGRASEAICDHAGKAVISYLAIWA